MLRMVFGFGFQVGWVLKNSLLVSGGSMLIVVERCALPHFIVFKVRYVVFKVRYVVLNRSIYVWSVVSKIGLYTRIYSRIVLYTHVCTYLHIVEGHDGGLGCMVNLCMIFQW